MDTKAIRPSFFQSLPTLIKEEEAKKKGLTGEEQELFALSQSGGWKILREYIESLIIDLNSGTEVAMKNGLSFEEIGRNAVVIDLAKSIIRNILNKVDDAQEQANEK